MTLHPAGTDETVLCGLPAVPTLPDLTHDLHSPGTDETVPCGHRAVPTFPDLTHDLHSPGTDETVLCAAVCCRVVIVLTPSWPAGTCSVCWGWAAPRRSQDVPSDWTPRCARWPRRGCAEP